MRKKEGVIRYVIAFLLPIVLWMAVFAFNEQYPFGDKTLLIWDTNYQYVALLSHFHDILHGNASFFYSLSDSLGGNAYAIGSYYYLFSPIHWIAFFFEKEHMYICVLIIVLIKLGLSGLSMNVYLSYRNHSCNRNLLLAFSTAYAASSYVSAYFYNFMWLDAVIILPVIVLGIDCLLDKKAYGKYIFVASLASSIIINYYVAFMVCIFVGLYFLFSFDRWKRDLKVLGEFVLFAFLSEISSTFVTIPGLLAIISRDESITNSSKVSLLWDGKLTNIMWGTTPQTQIQNGNPLWYVGIAVLICAICAFVGKTSYKYKLKYGFLLLIFLLSNVIVPLDLVWGLGHEPSGCPYRYMFIATFLLVVIAADSAATIDAEKNKENAKCLIISAIILVVIFSLVKLIYKEDITSQLLIKNLLLVVISLVILLISFTKSFYPVLILLILVDLGSNAYYYENGNAVFDTETVDTYESDSKALLSLTSNEAIDNRYRVEYGTAAREMQMDTPFLTGTKSITGYSSLESQEKCLVLKALGYETTDNGDYLVYDEDNTKTAEALLGINYIVTAREYSEYKLIDQKDNLRLYETGLGLPMAYLSDTDIIDISQDSYSNYFEWMNALLEAIKSGSGTFDQMGIESVNIINGAANEVDGIYEATADGTQIMMMYKDQNLEDSRIAYLRYGFDDEELEKINIYVGGEEISLDNQKTAVKNLGEVNSEDEVMIVITLNTADIFDIHKLGVYTENVEKLSDLGECLSQQAIDIDYGHGNVIKANVNFGDNQTLILPVVWEKGWKLYIDGKQEEISGKIVYNLMAISALAGEHQIVLKYTPPGLVTGAIISLLGLFMVLGYLWIEHSRKRYELS